MPPELPPELPRSIALAAAAAVRAALVGYSWLHDGAAELAYSDIDYLVVSDGAALIGSGGSPFHRPTYRYSPLLALALLPNTWLGPSFGKLLFCAADLAVGALLHAVLLARRVPPRVALRCASSLRARPRSAILSQA